MAAFPWRDCGMSASLVRRKEEAVGGCPSDALTKKRTQCLWPRCSRSLSWGSKAISTRAHPGVSSSSGHCSCSCHHEKLSLYGKFVFGSLYTIQVPVSFLLREKHEASPGSSLMIGIKLFLLWICVEIPAEVQRFSACVTNSVCILFLIISIMTKNPVLIALAMNPVICKGMTSNKFYPLNPKQFM